MESPNIPISSRSKATLRDLAKLEGIERYRPDKFFRDLDETYARLQAYPEAWKEELAERQLWQTTLVDGLEKE